MTLSHVIERARLLCTGETPPWPAPIFDVHGPAVTFEFWRHWNTFAALERRRAVLVGRDDMRQAGHSPEALDSLFLRLESTVENHPIFVQSAPTGKAELAEWLARDATPEEIHAFADYRAGAITLQPTDCPQAVILILFSNLVHHLERLPTRDELRKALFPSRKTVVSAKDRAAFKRNLDAVGLAGLPEVFHGPHQWTPEELEGEDPRAAMSNPSA